MILTIATTTVLNKYLISITTSYIFNSVREVKDESFAILFRTESVIITKELIRNSIRRANQNRIEKKRA